MNPVDSSDPYGLGNRPINDYGNGLPHSGMGEGNTTGVDLGLGGWQGGQDARYGDSGYGSINYGNRGEYGGSVRDYYNDASNYDRGRLLGDPPPEEDKKVTRTRTAGSNAGGGNSSGRGQAYGLGGNVRVYDSGRLQGSRTQGGGGSAPMSPWHEPPAIG